MRLPTDIEPAIHDFSTRIEGKDMLLRMVVAVFGETARLSYCSGPQAFNLANAAPPKGWRRFDRAPNNYPVAQVERIIEWRESLSYEETVAASRETLDTPFRTRTTAFLLTLKTVDDYQVLEIKPDPVVHTAAPQSHRPGSRHPNSRLQPLLEDPLRA